MDSYGFYVQRLGEMHNEGVTASNNNGVWKQALVHTCGEKRIHTAFPEAKLVTGFLARAPLESSIGWKNYLTM